LERTDNSYAQALAYWKHSIAMLRFLQEKEVDLVLIRFEDLLAQPREELRKVCDFLDLTYSESMLSGTASDRIFIDYRQQGLDAQKLQRKIDPRVKIADIEKELISVGYLSKG
jgi:hypothetical protein